MNNKTWATVAPIGGFFGRPEAPNLPFYFSDDISLQLLPDWITSDNDLDLLRPRLRQAIKDKKAEYCLLVEYQADALGMPDPSYIGPEARSIQDAALAKIYVVMLSLWLARPTGVHYREIAHCERNGGDWLVRQIADHFRFWPLPEYSYNQISAEDADRAKRLFDVLFNAPQKGPVWAAVSSLGLALTQKEWILRYLLFWLALEALFGPDDAREITFRISQRIAFFLTRGEKSRHEMFDDMKESYKWRSKIVHGVRISKLKSELSAILITNLEDTARRALLTILEDNALAKIFTGKGRERYLDDLVFER